VVSQGGGFEEVSIQNGGGVDFAEAGPLDLGGGPVFGDFIVGSPACRGSDMATDHIQNLGVVNGLEFVIFVRKNLEPAVVNAFE
jgi:hypothetical protein